MAALCTRSCSLPVSSALHTWTRCGLAEWSFLIGNHVLLPTFQTALASSVQVIAAATSNAVQLPPCTVIVSTQLPGRGSSDLPTPLPELWSALDTLGLLDRFLEQLAGVSVAFKRLAFGKRSKRADVK